MVLLVPNEYAQCTISIPYEGTCFCMVLGPLDVHYVVAVGNIFSIIPISSTFLVCLVLRLDTHELVILWYSGKFFCL